MLTYRILKRSPFFEVETRKVENMMTEQNLRRMDCCETCPKTSYPFVSTSTRKLVADLENNDS